MKSLLLLTAVTAVTAIASIPTLTALTALLPSAIGLKCIDGTPGKYKVLDMCNECLTVKKITRIGLATTTTVSSKRCARVTCSEEFGRTTSAWTLGYSDECCRDADNCNAYHGDNGKELVTCTTGVQVQGEERQSEAVQPNCEYCIAATGTDGRGKDVLVKECWTRDNLKCPDPTKYKAHVLQYFDLNLTFSEVPKCCPSFGAEVCRDEALPEEEGEMETDSSGRMDRPVVVAVIAVFLVTFYLPLP